MGHHPRRGTPAALSTLAGTLAAALAVAVCGGAQAHAPALASSPRAQTPTAAGVFERTATYPVYLNRPVGEDSAAATVAEISTVTEDGRTVIYTDALARRIGFVDITNPGAPTGLGTLSLSVLGNAEDEPTSVAVVGPYVLVVVNTSPSFTAPSGRLDVIRLSDRTRVRSLDLGGQPDSIAISKDKRYAAIAIENERDEDVAPSGGEEGDLPQAPGGFLQIVDLTGGDPAGWGLRTVSFGGTGPLAGLPGLDTPSDPEPEYVTVNGKGVAAVTLQENNAIALVDLPSGKVLRSFSAGSVSLTGIDTVEDDGIDLSGSLTGVVREPDGVSWIDDRYFATANEGDWKGGSRGWSIFDSTSGKVVWDAGNSVERLAVSYGHQDDARTENKGVEPENVVVSTVGGKRYAFVGSERGNFVAVYRLDSPTTPRLVQVLPTTNGPEGLLPVPSRGLFVASSELDEADVRVRASLSIFKLTGETEGLVSLVSKERNGVPIGWGALGALSAVPGSPNQLYAATDSAYAQTRILTLSVSGFGPEKPATITDSLPVSADGAPVGYDAEGLFARPQGGFWLGVEGATGPGNKLVRLDRKGATVELIPLPAEITAVIRPQGIEGITAVTDKHGREVVWVALQRELTTDPKGVARLGRYDVAAKSWSWFGYPLGSTSVAGDWIGLSEIVAVDANTFAVIERDKLNGPDAAVKRVYTVDVPAGPLPAAGTLPVLTKRLAVDVLPDLRATHGWTQEKLEGLTIAGNGTVYAITDNDGLSDATGETVLLELGRVSAILR